MVNLQTCLTWWQSAARSAALCTLGLLAAGPVSAANAADGPAQAKGGDIISTQARAALLPLIPEGYTTGAVIACELGAHDKGRYVAALVDSKADDPERVVRLLYLAWDGAHWTVLDNFAIAGLDGSYPPQYLSGLSVVPVGQQSLLYVFTTSFGGGSGSDQYFQLYRASGQHLQLVRSFEHGRMESGFFTLRNARVYDADVACSRGPKKGQAYIYSCYLDAKEFTYDGNQLVQTRREKVEPRTGNRFLFESYRNESLYAVIQRDGYFANPDGLPRP